jgi:hypothetical protein
VIDDVTSELNSLVVACHFCIQHLTELFQKLLVRSQLVRRAVVTFGGRLLVLRDTALQPESLEPLAMPLSGGASQGK